MPVARSPHTASEPRRRRRRTRGLALAGATAVLLAPALTACEPPPPRPTAPAVTADGIALRVDETAFAAPVIDQIEASMQPFVDQMIRDGAAADPPVNNPESITATSDLELSLDFLAPSAERPSGGLAIHATISAIEITYRKNPAIGSRCSIWARPDTGTIDASASVDRTLLPSTPLRIDPIRATWDDSPSVSTSGVCWTYLIDDAIAGWWDDMWGNDSASTASKIEANLNGQLQTLVDDLWAEKVAPVLDSATGFGVSVAQLRTDDHGLLVTADVDGSRFSLLGIPLDVSRAVDAGVSSDVDALLAQRSTAAGPSDVIVSVHPNVANQFLAGITALSGGALATTPLDAGIEQVLLPAGAGAAYADGGWSASLSATATPYVEPTGAGGGPRLVLPAARLVITNTSVAGPVATFDGLVAAIDLRTLVRPGATTWGPTFATDGLQGLLVRSQANADVAARNPVPSTLLPTARAAFDAFNANTLVQFVSLSPIALGSNGLGVGLCTTCGRYPGDQRYTETFHVG